MSEHGEFSAGYALGLLDGGARLLARVVEELGPDHPALPRLREFAGRRGSTDRAAPADEGPDDDGILDALAYAELWAEDE